MLLENSYIRHQIVDASYAIELQDSESKELILQIYHENKETIDFIVKVGDSVLKEAFFIGCSREKLYKRTI